MGIVTVPLNLDLTKGMFVGHDYGVSRETQNSFIDYVHSKGLKVFANAWFPSDYLDPDEGPVSMGVGDWALLESYYITSGEYAGESIGGFTNAYAKYARTVELSKAVGTKVCGLVYAFTSAPVIDQNELNNAYVLSVGLGVDSICFSADDLTDVERFLPDIPFPKTGLTLTSALKQIDADTFEATTDEGVLQFIAKDNPAYRGHKVFAIPPKVFVAPITLPVINAQTYKINYYSSPDKTTWHEIPGSTVLVVKDRYLRAEIVLRN